MSGKLRKIINKVLINNNLKQIDLIEYYEDGNIQSEKNARLFVSYYEDGNIKRSEKKDGNDKLIKQYSENGILTYYAYPLKKIEYNFYHDAINSINADKMKTFSEELLKLLENTFEK
jgi:hypothetical protein